MTKSALTGGFSGVPGGAAHFTRLSRRVLLSLFGGGACFAHLSAAPLLWKIRLHRRIFRRSRRRCSLRAPVRRQLFLMEEPPIKAVRLAFPAGVLASRACPAAPLYEKSAFAGGFSGVPGGSRTHGLSLRRRTLYPAELRKRFRCCFILGVRARFVKRNAQSGGGTLGTKSAPLCG